jgi:hypothetical protein
MPLRTGSCLRFSISRAPAAFSHTPSTLHHRQKCRTLQTFDFASSSRLQFNSSTFASQPSTSRPRGTANPITRLLARPRYIAQTLWPSRSSAPRISAGHDGHRIPAPPTSSKDLDRPWYQAPLFPLYLRPSTSTFRSVLHCTHRQRLAMSTLSQPQTPAALGSPLREHRHRPVERVTDRLETPSLDDRSYRVIRLPNQLEVLLVHDADTDKASAAMDVNVGNFSDPSEFPGMAHAVSSSASIPFLDEG